MKKNMFTPNRIAAMTILSDGLEHEVVEFIKVYGDHPPEYPLHSIHRTVSDIVLYLKSKDIHVVRHEYGNIVYYSVTGHDLDSMMLLLTEARKKANTVNYKLVSVIYKTDTSHDFVSYIKKKMDNDSVRFLVKDKVKRHDIYVHKNDMKLFNKICK